MRFSLILLAFFLGLNAQADGLKRWGLEFKNFPSPGGSTNFGDLLAYRYAFFLGKTGINLGLELGAGASRITNISRRDHLYYGGFTAGYEDIIAKTFIWEVGFLAAYSEARMDSANLLNYGTLLEPTLGFGFILAGGWRISFRGGYFIAPTAREITGFTFGIRLDQKFQTTSKGVDE